MGAGREFLTIMAGASYQAREHKLWVNSFLWCELDYDNKQLCLEPRQWSRDNQEWTSASSNFPEILRVRNENGESLAYWHTPLPGLGELQYKTPIQKNGIHPVDGSTLPRHFWQPMQKNLKIHNCCNSSMVGSLSGGTRSLQHSSTRKGISVSTISTRCASAGPSTGYSSARAGGRGEIHHVKASSL